MVSGDAAFDRGGDNTRIERVVIVGGGTAGWMTAAALAKTVPAHVKIVLIESEEIGTVGVGEATIPSIRTFNNILGLDEFDFIRYTHATYKLGIEFVDWNRLGERYFHPFGDHGRHTQEFKFLQLWLRLKSGYARGMCPDPGPISDYNLCSVAAARGRFLTTNGATSTPGPSLRYAFHFDASLYAKYLRRYAEGRGVTRIEGRIAGTDLRSDDGFISSVTLDDGRTIAADLFVDCSGFRGLLIEGHLNAGFESWSQFLPCDRAVAVGSEPLSDFPPYTRATADSAGWRWRIPLQHRVGNGYVFSSDHISQDEATARLLSQIEGKPINDPHLITFTAGHRRSMWVKNCVAIGLSGGFIEPLESTGIHLIQTGIAKLLLFFPDKRFAQANIDEFNVATLLEYEAVRDFIILHYCATERSDSSFWRERGAMVIPERLKARMSLFCSTGRIFRYQDELFTDDSWLAVMLGQGVTPKSYDPLVDKIPLPEIAKNVARLRQITAQVVDSMPSHRDFIRQYCGAATVD
ncbi:tryptophan halogenase family protein [Asticcacaulis benevestitus]|uniref:Tryptophan halogenase n=1 Tax=Asticcacaulis benevestitus DSM 16100 = ATCC BAA-896 TaxID=1121022 RepID=V4PLZ9_9CAUL|nr:tryptophan halogenase family protein [Asticcacaulis benevestitus]ESQ86495.1 hypothetical protein ABENE_18400 [Asticcacaulis benevestitus DSM 16100 = ATCC BAA-896]